MRTNIDIQDDLLSEAMRLTGTQTKRETVDLALRRMVQAERALRVRELFASGVAEKYDHKQARGKARA
jgi:Arc/MetJ family transcription regulator